MCNHDFQWIQGIKGNKTFKVNVCSLCKEIDDVVIKDMVDPKDKKLRLMFFCVDSVREHYPYLPEEQKMSCAISLFIDYSRNGGM